MSLLLGATFVVTPMAQTANASVSNPPLTANPFPVRIAEQSLCFGLLPESVMSVNTALVPPQFERVDATGTNKLVITSSKDSAAGSMMPVETVLKKVTGDEMKEDVYVSPTPSVSLEPLPTIPDVSNGVNTSNLSSSGSVLNADTLFNLVNATRAQYGLPPFEKSDWVCSMAAMRAPEVDNEIWVTHAMHAGFWGRNPQYWSTENLISMQNEQAAVNWWLNSSVHRAAVLGTWKYACAACSGKSCSMIFSNMEAKYAAPSPQQSTVIPIGASPTPNTVTTVLQSNTK